MGQFGILDEGLIGGVKQDQGVVGQGVIDPLLQLGLGGYGPGGIVGEAEVDQIHLALGERRSEAIAGRDGQVGEAAVLAGIVGIAGPAGHHVAVHVHRVHGVSHGNAVALSQDVEDVAAVAFGAVGDKDLLGAHLATTGLEIGLGDGLPQPGIALFGAIAMEALPGAHLINGAFHRRATGLG